MSAPGPEVAGWRGWLGVPTVRLALLTLLPLLASFGVFASREVVIPVIALDLVLLALAVGDLALTRQHLVVTRQVAPVQVVGRPFDVKLRFENQGQRPILLRCTDDAPGTPQGIPANLQLDDLPVELVYLLRIDTRGHHSFGDVTVRSRSPLGLWERQSNHRIPGSVRVYPTFIRSRERPTGSRLAEEHVPVRARRRPGGENEFQRLRPYVAGDAYRHIDWKATARRQEFVTREFGQESNQNLLLLLDCGRMTSARSGALSAFDHALNAAILLGQVALKHGDRVGLLAYDRSIRAWLPPRGGARTVHRLIHATYDVRPSMEEPNHLLALRYLSERVRRRSLVVVLTAVQDEPTADLATALVHGLASRHLAVAVWIRDAEVHALAEAPVVDEAGAYVRAAAAELVGWRERSLAALRRKGALVVDAAPGEVTSTLIHRYLEVKARRLL